MSQTSKLESVNFFAVIDDRLGNRSEHQDERLLFYLTRVEYNQLVITINHILSYILLVNKFCGNIQIIKTKNYVTFIYSPIPHYYFLLRILREQENTNYYYYSKYLKTLVDTFLVLNGNELNKSITNELLEMYFNNIFTTFTFNKIFEYLYQLRNGIIPSSSFISLKSKMNLLHSKYPTFKTCFIIRNNSILFNELDQSQILPFYHLINVHAPLKSSLPSMKLNKWLYSNHLIPIYPLINNIIWYIDIFINVKLTIKTVFVVICTSNKSLPYSFYKEFDIQNIQNSFSESKSCISVNSLLKSCLYLHYDGVFLTTNIPHQKNESPFYFVLRHIELLRKNTIHSLWLIDKNSVIILKKELNKLLLSKFFVLPERTMNWINNAFEDLSIYSFV
ncbi:hypothetical protein EHI8A_044760 [Entamoeba histolytica HM-1:IMSS-B]|uniref:CCZ1/INTU/HSP4 first Longin domain-containing protein n=6 Tax=Entamoeba histolytica TaxID=5759 RepID=C4LZ74_ENTH1|nr:hypothetical protein EHI_104650 [Entamoeba histolytica HM-1:IMSS]EMD47236.1 Hypothetical protein EHI5A_077740 [Entamoeba histolytica KU27]EMH73723.1 hypothetical protein EHI8A_044760 [Entamoeba histolytica HM-1:IMSS-B]EMS16094.1 hypothetical protein KM1_026080 [Entamoeba histolytica HM-3:IMSS]ENY62036.1 hypothetical protein EHI7A_045110 [Entamoeba histolytica HM-1:IMSS-A]EAL45191.1 hypothetical protein EHI_104650 [Entamoeba histolytica HM-1:IMSS]|eukprot:XP_650577.1 hypothetical protein EHI_104650 [Entamoeba histolytica HM-1:IMSS]